MKLKSTKVKIFNNILLVLLIFLIALNTKKIGCEITILIIALLCFWILIYNYVSYNRLFGINNNDGINSSVNNDNSINNQ